MRVLKWSFVHDGVPYEMLRTAPDDWKDQPIHQVLYKMSKSKVEAQAASLGVTATFAERTLPADWDGNWEAL